MSKFEAPYCERLCLTIEEAADYSMIGEKRLRAIIENDQSINWVLKVGSWIRIKRPLFEEWVLKQNNL